ncbi:MAG: UDP-N-acetylmuramyl-tripeptide synthetases family protein [Candidatus Xenolissoclinum pacificiensis L6]|uniref:UDP-N-acetylmuramyl-tripeptide synthetases family protein n=1 Tax=Candidatus Xenolissoclinum pacificiensis L6 TaxID=1401685 RepID=W2V1Q1_9RICK|nr:MAG: UDP-N-acetylmuramyl-tripeptide synthetases family protein [Candidatus Xenolissoclinum pacificiensis L6]
MQSIEKIIKEKILDIYSNDIKGVVANSEDVLEGYVFFVLSGNAGRYVKDAVKRGAILVVLPTAIDADLDEKFEHYVYFDDIHIAYSILSSKVYSGQPKNLVAVTGTNGKTSVVRMLYRLFDYNHRTAVSLGTIGIQSNIELDSGLIQQNITTPDAGALHKTMSVLYKAGVQNAFIEMSSHGLKQRRGDSLAYSFVAFTNLSRDHLDYHSSYEEYFHVKLRLFSALMRQDTVAIINSDIPEYKALKSSVGERVCIEYGFNAKGDDAIVLLEQKPLGSNGQVIKYAHNGRHFEITTALFGKFQIYNIAIVLAIAHKLSLESFDFTKDLMIHGRMDLVCNKPRVLIDFAHTPDALYSLISSVRWHYPTDKIILIFGCGGDRDRGKRKLMGRIAYEYADKIIICNDNVRYEDEDQIISDILKGIEGKDFFIIKNRVSAVEFAMKNYQDHIIVLAGRGHEKKQYIGDTIISHSDYDIFKRLLKTI